MAAKEIERERERERKGYKRHTVGYTQQIQTGVQSLKHTNKSHTHIHTCMQSSGWCISETVHYPYSAKFLQVFNFANFQPFMNSSTKIFDTWRAVCGCSEFTKLFQRNLHKIALHENLHAQKFSTIRCIIFGLIVYKYSPFPDPQRDPQRDP